MLKCACFKGSSPTEFRKRECDSALLDRSKIASPIFSTFFQTGPSPRKRLWFYLNFPHIKGKTLTTFCSAEKVLCVTFCKI